MIVSSLRSKTHNTYYYYYYFLLQYTTGQTWLGIAVTIGYSYFGLNEKKRGANTNGQGNNGAAQGANDGDSGVDGWEEARFTDERGEEKVVKTHQELNDFIHHYDTLLNELDDRSVSYEAAIDQKRYSYCLDQLDKLKEKLPALEQLKSKLAEAEAKTKAAADKQEYGNAEKFHQDVIQLRKKMKEEEDAAALRTTL